MRTPPRKSPAGGRGLGNSTCPGRSGRRDYSASVLPASARFDSVGLLLPSMRDASAIAAAIIISGALDIELKNSRADGWSLYRGWRLYQGKWFAVHGRKTRRMAGHDMEAWLFHLLAKCVVVDRAGRMRPFNTRRANVRAVRCAMGRALTVCEDPMRELTVTGVSRG